MSLKQEVLEAGEHKSLLERRGRLLRHLAETLFIPGEHAIVQIRQQRAIRARIFVPLFLSFLSETIGSDRKLRKRRVNLDFLCKAKDGERVTGW